MVDRQLLRQTPEVAAHGARRKGIDAPIDEAVKLIAERNEVLTSLESDKAEMNRLSKSIGMLMSQGKREEAEQAKAQTGDLKERIRQAEERLRSVEETLTQAELNIPNPPHESVPEGMTSDENVEVRSWGDLPKFDDEPKPHWDIASALAMLDMERGAKISGSGFALYTGWGARLQRALISFMIDHQTLKNGYREVYPPYLVLRSTMEGTGQLPKFEDDLYRTDDDRFLIPTAEVPVTNLYREEILEDSQLTMKMAAYSGCFRKEAGAAGKDTRGIQRMHQFDKVELVKLTRPEDSYNELESLVVDAESVLQAMGLHYRVVLLCAGEMSFSNAKCYDLEVWSPGVGRYLEISSCSNFEAFQARRASIRFRRAQGEKPEFVHTLNGSGLATPRLFAAVLECGQRPDGSVVLPEVLRPYVGTDVIRP